MAELRDTLERLLNRQDLAEPEAAGLLVALTDPAMPPAMAGAMLAALRSKGLTADEVRGFASAMRKLAWRLGWLDRHAGAEVVAELMELLDIRPRQPQLLARALSGSNQQKVILAKWLARRVAVLLLEEPTQGIDVAAKAQIHALIRDFAGRGGVLINSSDLAELARLCERVLAVRQGRITATLDRATGLGEPKLRAAIGG